MKFFLVFTLLFSDEGCCKGSSHRSCGQRSLSCVGSTSSELAQQLFEFAQSVAPGLMLSTPLLFCVQLPFSSLTSLQDLISSSVFSPEKSLK